MRRFARWLAGLVGLAALARLYVGRRHRTVAPTSPPEPDPAEELRRKLAEVRASAPVSTPGGAAPEAAPASEPGEAAPGPTLDERRAAIHARAQEAIDAMREVDG